MDCRTFRRKHLAFVDDTLPGVDVVQMERHRSECAACERHDADIRRSLLLIRNNLPEIQPSADFSSRLAKRLEAERQRQAAPAPLFRGPGVNGFLSMSMGMVVVGMLAVAVTDGPAPPQMARLPGVIVRPMGASLGMNSAVPLAPPVAPSAFVASVSTGMAIWPALLMMEEAQSRYAGEGEFTPVQTVNYAPGTQR